MKERATEKEYYRLLSDGSYRDVRFNPKSGALLAIHKEHHFDPTIGKFGIPRGDYERIASEILYEYGRNIVLDSEYKKDGVKAPEGFLDGRKFDIKGIEGTGKRNIEYRIYDASRQGAEVIVLYYHDASVFSKQNIINGYRAYLRNSKSKRIRTLYYIVDKKLHKMDL